MTNNKKKKNYFVLKLMECKLMLCREQTYVMKKTSLLNVAMCE